ncbi:hypothetical protein ACIBCD_15490 [Nocardia brasiliensis]|uniref:terpene synthase family protein n=1 Tax=Nocardia brasiliensis TaxID=37326 RepID=UPI0037AF09D6
MTDHDLIVPALDMPIPHRTHPALDHGRARIIDWLAEVGLYPDTAAASEAETRDAFSEMTAWCYPFGTDPQRFAIGVQAVMAFTSLDDYCLEPPQSHGRFDVSVKYVMGFQKISDNPRNELAREHANEPALRAWLDVCLRMIELDGWETHQRIADAATMFMLAAQSEMPYRAARTLPDIDTYLTLRSRTAVYYQLGELMNFIAGRHIPARTMADPTLRELAKSCSLAAGLIDDILNLPNEPDPPLSFSLPSVLAYNKGYSLQEGIDESALLYQRYMDRIIELQAELATHPDPDMHYLAEAYPHVTEGFHWWCLHRTHRYSSQARYARG